MRKIKKILGVSKKGNKENVIKPNNYYYYYFFIKNMLYYFASMKDFTDKYIFRRMTYT